MVLGSKRAAKEQTQAVEVRQDGFAAGGYGLNDLPTLGRDLLSSVLGGAPPPQNWQDQNKKQANETIVEWTEKLGMSFLQFKGLGDNVTISEVSKRRDAMNEGDVFVLDCTDTIYIWYGKLSNKDERKAASDFARRLKKTRGPGTQVTLLEQEGGKDQNPHFWKLIRAHPKKASDLTPSGIIKGIGGYHVQKANGGDEKVHAPVKKLYPMIPLKNGKVYREGEKTTKRFLENHGLMKKKRLRAHDSDNGKFDRALLESSKAYLLDDGQAIWVWMGAFTHIREDQALEKATAYLQAKNNHLLHKSHNRPKSLPILLVAEGREPKDFKHNFFSVQRSHQANAVFYDGL